VKLLRLAGLLALLVGLLAPVASVSAASAIYVHPGQSIQAAIDKAPAGALISVERGTYKGNLEIKRSLRLVGHDAIIVPAAKPTQNPCLALVSGLVVGICVHGTFTSDGSIAKSISHVSIEGFTVRNFNGFGIIAAGVKGFRAARVVTAHNGAMGMLVDASSDVSLLYNRSYGNGADGIQVDGSPANAVIVGNASYDNLGAGILFVDSKGGRIELNSTYGNCAGIVVAATGTPGQSGAGDVSVQLNQVTANSRPCPAVPDSGVPAYGGIGIALIGARNTVVALNDVRGNLAQTGSGITGGGIVLLDGKMFGAGTPSGNSVRLDWLSGNTPNDIYGDGTGTTNTVSGNTCTATNLTGAC
jgi:hypothetical protein